MRSIFESPEINGARGGARFDPKREKIVYIENVLPKEGSNNREEAGEEDEEEERGGVLSFLPLVQFYFNAQFPIRQ